MGIIAFCILGGLNFLFGPGFGSIGRAVASVLLYGVAFFACFVVVKQRR